MARTKKKVTTVRTYPRHVRVSQKNPAGITIVDQHLRRLPGTYLDRKEIEHIYQSYPRDGLRFPTASNLGFKSGNQYDEPIAVWTDYFNKKFSANPRLDPDVVKALIASESEFEVDPKGNKTAFGICQITKATLTILQDPNGEAKDFLFNSLRLKDLKSPNIAIPAATRWLFRKLETASHKLKRPPTNEELILEYKGLLKSKTAYKISALKSFRKYYDLLKTK
jgi:hypothetical protein